MGGKSICYMVKERLNNGAKIITIFIVVLPANLCGDNRKCFTRTAHTTTK